ncbi:Clp protease N-terminal domain-containing protein [Microbispora sp. NPDC049125]|uniref:Clp protease N-terminal domain-containing protein n=1 Tax=Microbispora sp. NPDC049125 TaxID=3154929 RepID=UPI003465010C
MPKINVYLPDELAEAVKKAKLPVSAICQQALEQAVRRVTAIQLDDPEGRMSRLTARTKAVLELARDRAHAEAAHGIGTEHLLSGMLAEGQNLALHVLRAMEIDPVQLQRDLDARKGNREETGEDGTQAGEEARRFDPMAAAALELTVTEALGLGHNYVGCEHLLLGLIAEPDGPAGQILRARGAELRPTRRAVAAALAGYVHLRAQSQEAAPASGGPAAQSAAEAVAAVVRRELAPISERIERLERHAGLAAPSGAPTRDGGPAEGEQGEGGR